MVAEDTNPTAVEIASADVVLFVKPGCPFCATAEEQLKAHNIPYKTVVNENHLEELKRRTGKTSAPSTWIKGTYVGGCNDGTEPWHGVKPMLKSGKFHEMLGIEKKEPAEAPAPQEGMVEKRIDPEDNTAYTWEELSAYYKGKYKNKDINTYWEETCWPQKRKSKGRKNASKTASRTVKVGDKVPDVSLDLGFPPTKVGLKSLSEQYKKLVIVGLPGAFTPT